MIWFVAVLAALFVAARAGCPQNCSADCTFEGDGTNATPLRWHETIESAARNNCNAVCINGSVKLTELSSYNSYRQVILNADLLIEAGGVLPLNNIEFCGRMKSFRVRATNSSLTVNFRSDSRWSLHRIIGDFSVKSNAENTQVMLTDFPMIKVASSLEIGSNILTFQAPLGDLEIVGKFSLPSLGPQRSMLQDAPWPTFPNLKAIHYLDIEQYRYPRNTGGGVSPYCMFGNSNLVVSNLKWTAHLGLDSDEASQNIALNSFADCLLTPKSLSLGDAVFQFPENQAADSPFAVRFVSKVMQHVRHAETLTIKIPETGLTAHYDDKEISLPNLRWVTNKLEVTDPSSSANTRMRLLLPRLESVHKAGFALNGVVDFNLCALTHAYSLTIAVEAYAQVYDYWQNAEWQISSSSSPPQDRTFDKTVVTFPDPSIQQCPSGQLHYSSVMPTTSNVRLYEHPAVDDMVATYLHNQATVHNNFSLSINGSEIFECNSTTTPMLYFVGGSNATGDSLASLQLSKMVALRAENDWEVNSLVQALRHRMRRRVMRLPVSHTGQVAVPQDSQGHVIGRCILDDVNDIAISTMFKKKDDDSYALTFQGPRQPEYSVTVEPFTPSHLLVSASSPKVPIDVFGTFDTFSVAVMLRNMRRMPGQPYEGSSPRIPDLPGDVRWEAVTEGYPEKTFSLPAVIDVSQMTYRHDVYLSHASLRKMARFASDGNAIELTGRFVFGAMDLYRDADESACHDFKGDEIASCWSRQTTQSLGVVMHGRPVFSLQAAALNAHGLPSTVLDSAALGINWADTLGPDNDRLMKVAFRLKYRNLNVDSAQVVYESEHLRTNNDAVSLGALPWTALSLGVDRVPLGVLVLECLGYYGPNFANDQSETHLCTPTVLSDRFLRTYNGWLLDYTWPDEVTGAREDMCNGTVLPTFSLPEQPNMFDVVWNYGDIDSHNNLTLSLPYALPVDWSKKSNATDGRGNKFELAGVMLIPTYVNMTGSPAPYVPSDEAKYFWIGPEQWSFGPLSSATGIEYLSEVTFDIHSFLQPYKLDLVNDVPLELVFHLQLPARHGSTGCLENHGEVPTVPNVFNSFRLQPFYEKPRLRLLTLAPQQRLSAAVMTPVAAVDISITSASTMISPMPRHAIEIVASGIRPEWFGVKAPEQVAGEELRRGFVRADCLSPVQCDNRHTRRIVVDFTTYVSIGPELKQVKDFDMQLEYYSELDQFFWGSSMLHFDTWPDYAAMRESGQLQSVQDAVFTITSVRSANTETGSCRNDEPPFTCRDSGRVELCQSVSNCAVDADDNDWLIMSGTGLDVFLLPNRQAFHGVRAAVHIADRWQVRQGTRAQWQALPTATQSEESRISYGALEFVDLSTAESLQATLHVTVPSAVNETLFNMTNGERGIVALFRSPKGPASYGMSAGMRVHLNFNVSHALRSGSKPGETPATDDPTDMACDPPDQCTAYGHMMDSFALPVGQQAKFYPLLSYSSAFYVQLSQANVVSGTNCEVQGNTLVNCPRTGAGALLRLLCINMADRMSYGIRIGGASLHNDSVVSLGEGNVLGSMFLDFYLPMIPKTVPGDFTFGLEVLSLRNETEYTQEDWESDLPNVVETGFRIQYEPCPSNHEPSSEYPAQCVPCKSGWTSEGGEMCTQCAPGTYALVTATESKCVECGAFEFNPLPEQTECQPCFGANTIVRQGEEYVPVTGLAACNPCSAGQYAPIANGRVLGPCQLCPPGALCSDGQIVALEDYWLDYGETTGNIGAYRCYQGHCRAGDLCASDTADSTTAQPQVCCSENRKAASENPLCGVCLDEYYEWGGSCIKCDNDGSVAGNIAAVVVMYVLYVCVMHYLAQSLRDASVRIMLYYVQMSKMFAGAIDVSLSGWVAKLFFGLFQMDIVAMTGGSMCYGRVSALTRIWTSVLTPLFTLGILVFPTPP
ncbi:MAG: hypothetical protein MHM6MM_002018 [Cercozoa sp. M6MM]